MLVFVCVGGWIISGAPSSSTDPVGLFGIAASRVVAVAVVVVSSAVVLPPLFSIIPP